MQRILIANRGEIALRIAKSAKKLGMWVIGMASEPDREALFTESCDEVHLLKGETPAETYLNLEAIEEVIQKSGAQLLHPGYGFLSERTSLLDLCIKTGVRFIGPDFQALEMMGDKITSKRLMEEGGVPTIPGFFLDGIEDSEIQTQAQAIGYPIMVKAAAGGGGKGMRRVNRSEELLDAIASCRREAQSSFGDDRIFVEKFIVNPRHIEVQILGDTHGNLIALGERECSIQRRNQKILEECPSSFVDQAVREKLCEAAVLAGKLVNYVSAGTIEFVMGEDHSFYFLEMNTRLQVEHPVTEMVYGVDLVEEQIQIAKGYPVSIGVLEASPKGHAVEVRIYAEEPLENFMPSAGKILALNLPQEDQNLRLDNGVKAQDEISIFYDPMLLKLIAWGQTREAAVSKMFRALEDVAVLGIETNTSFLKDILSDEAFLKGEISTAFLEDGEILKGHRDRLMKELPALKAAAGLLWVGQRKKADQSGFDVKGLSC